MPKPYILITEPLLIKIFKDFSVGVPVAKLIKNYNLSMSQPTLNKLLNTYDILLNKSLVDSDYWTVWSSLFPCWPTMHSDNIMIQPATHVYYGTWPYGKWEARK